MQIFWTLLVVGILTWYAVIFVIVSRRGFSDLKEMFRELSKK